MRTNLAKRTVVALAAGAALTLTTAAGCGPAENPAPGVEQQDGDGQDGDGGQDDQGDDDQDDQGDDQQGDDQQDDGDDDN